MQLSINKIAAGVVGLAMVAGLAFAFTATRAHAITLSELVELFIALEVIPEDKADEARAVLDGQDETSTGGATMSCNFTRSLSQGDTGADVEDLQKLLNLKGFTVSASGAGSPGQETQYYGPATAGAVAAMQEAFAAEILTPLGLTAGTGYFGASTRAKANELCADDTDTPDVPDLPGDDDEDMDDEDELDGEEGSIDSVTEASADESTLDEGAEGGVLAFDVEIEGDVLIDRVDAYIEVDDSATASDDAEDYFERAYLMVDGDEVAEIDIDEFDDDQSGNVTNGGSDDEEYRLRFSDLDLVFEDEDEPEFQIGFEMVGSLDSSDLAGDWYVMADSMRFRDGQGWTDTYSISSVEETFGFGEEETAEIDITESNSNPESSVIKVESDTDETDDVPVFIFDVEEKNGIDVTIDDIRVTVVAAAPEAATVDDVVASAALVLDGDVLDTANVPANGVVDFENMDIDLGADGEIELTVELTLEGTNDGANYLNGQMISVNFTSIRDAEDENGNDEDEMDIDGTPQGDTHQLLSEGVFAEIVSDDSSKTNEETSGDDYATFELEFDVTAFEDDFYIPYGAGVTVSTEGALYRVETDSGAQATTTGTTTDGFSNTSGADTSGSFWVVQDGQTETFELTVTYDPVSNGTYRAQLDAIFYATSTSASLQRHNAAPAKDFETSTELINDN